MNIRLVTKLSIAAGLILAFTLSGCAPVTVSSVPSNAQVYRKSNDKLLGTTPIKVNLIANEKDVVIRKKGFFSKTIHLSPIDPESIEVALMRRDKVLLLSKPDGAEIFVEGLGRIGRTPFRMDYSKPYRTFEMKVPGYGTRAITISDDPEGDIVVEFQRDNSVIVVSKPKNADIYNLEGKKLGSTPLPISATKKQQFEMRKEGYYSQEFSIDEESANPFLLELEREPIIIVYSDPENAVVVYRGVTVGKTPYRQLVTEDMELEINIDRHYMKKITIGPDSPRLVKVDLDPKPYVTILSNPSEAALYRSGGVELLGKTPMEVLIEKDSSFEIHKAGYDIKPFILSPLSSRKVVVPLKKSVAAIEKIIVIDSKPSGARVFRPGGAEFIGKTPLKQHIRSERTFELQLDGFITKIVTVAPDSANNVVFALAKDESARNVTVSDPLLNTPSSF